MQHGLPSIKYDAPQHKITGLDQQGIY